MSGWEKHRGVRPAWIGALANDRFGWVLPVRFWADNADTGLSLKERIAGSGRAVFGIR
jgi:hypothetical protein